MIKEGCELFRYRNIEKVVQNHVQVTRIIFKKAHTVKPISNEFQGEIAFLALN
jgi:hypothetical protein